MANLAAVSGTRRQSVKLTNYQRCVLLLALESGAADHVDRQGVETLIERLSMDRPWAPQASLALWAERLA